MVAQYYEWIEYCWTVCLLMVNMVTFLLCVFYHNEQNWERKKNYTNGRFIFSVFSEYILTLPKITVTVDDS